MASITRLSRDDPDPIYEDLNNVVDSTDFADVDHYNYDVLSNAVRDVSLDTDGKWLTSH